MSKSDMSRTASRTHETAILFFVLIGLLSICFLVWSELHPRDVEAGRGESSTSVQSRARKKDVQEIREHFRTGRYSKKPAYFARDETER